MENPDQKQCKLCEKLIDSTKFRLHDTMCHRMNYKCNECNMVVPKADKSIHDDEVCGKPLEPSPLLPQHVEEQPALTENK